jgi:hypothetical protein
MLITYFTVTLTNPAQSASADSHQLSLLLKIDQKQAMNALFTIYYGNAFYKACIMSSPWLMLFILSICLQFTGRRKMNEDYKEIL